MHLTLVLVGLALAIVGSVLTRSRPVRFTRAEAVGLALFLVGEVILFEEGWWWALIGLVVPSLLIGVIDNVVSALKQR